MNESGTHLQPCACDLRECGLSYNREKRFQKKFVTGIWMGVYVYVYNLVGTAVLIPVSSTSDYLDMMLDWWRMNFTKKVCHSEQFLVSSFHYTWLIFIIKNKIYKKEKISTTGRGEEVVLTGRKITRSTLSSWKTVSMSYFCSFCKKSITFLEMSDKIYEGLSWCCW